MKIFGPITPFNDNSNSPLDYPTHEDIYGKGGLVVLETLAYGNETINSTSTSEAINDYLNYHISSPRRKEGMLAIFVVENIPQIWQLNTTWTPGIPDSLLLPALVTSEQTVGGIITGDKFPKGFSVLSLITDYLLDSDPLPVVSDLSYSIENVDSEQYPLDPYYEVKTSPFTNDSTITANWELPDNYSNNFTFNLATLNWISELVTPDNSPITGETPNFSVDITDETATCTINEQKHAVPRRYYTQLSGISINKSLPSPITIPQPNLRVLMTTTEYSIYYGFSSVAYIVVSGAITKTGSNARNPFFAYDRTAPYIDLPTFTSSSDAEFLCIAVPAQVYSNFKVIDLNTDLVIKGSITSLTDVTKNSEGISMTDTFSGTVAIDYVLFTSTNMFKNSFPIRIIKTE
jgi:hypothetical protein